MSNNMIDRPFFRDRVHIYVDGDVYACLHDKCRGTETVDDLMETLLADESQWPVARDRIAAPKPLPYHHDSLPEPMAVKSLSCRCCKDGCRCAFVWRGQYRCGCTKDRIAAMESR